MKQSCEVAPSSKKEYIKELGGILVRDYGKKKYYKPKEVRQAHKNSSYNNLDCSCWGISVFSSHADFDSYHESTGETCDYVSMKAEMLQGLSASGSEGSFDISSLDMDSSWVDFGEVFGSVVEGIGEFIAGLFDGV